MWLRGRHQLKFGYRLVNRRPSPFTHTDTRSTITFGTSFMNDPVTNSGGTGLAEVLLGNFNCCRPRLLARALHLAGRRTRDVRAGRFQGEQPADPQPGVRYEIFKAPTEEDNRLANFDYETFRMVYAGEDGTSRSANKKTHYGDFAPRIGLTYDLTGDARTILRTGFGITYFPDPPVREQPAGHQCAVRDFTERESRDKPARHVEAANDRRPVPHDRTGETADDSRADRGQPPRAGPQLRERDAVRRAVASRDRAPAVLDHAAGVVVRRQRREAPHRLLQPERGAAGTGIAAVASAAPADCDRQQHAAVRPAQPVDVQCRHGQVPAAIHQRPAVPGQLHLRQIARLRRVGRQRRRCGWQRADDYRHRSVARTVGLRHAAPWRHQLCLRVAVRAQSQWLKDGGALGAVVGGWQLAGITTLTTGRPFSVLLQTGVNNGAPSWPNRVASGELDKPTVDLWFILRRSSRRPTTPTATPAAASSTRRDTSISTRRCRSASACSVRATPNSGGTRSTCSIIQASGSRTRRLATPAPVASPRRSSTTGACSSR